MTIDDLVSDLADRDPQRRRAALTELQARATGFLPPSAIGALHRAATDPDAEPDAELRPLAELALLTQLWRFSDFRKALPLVAQASGEERAAIVAEPRPAEAVAPRLAPIVLRALDDPATRAVALRLLEPLRRFGGAVDAAIVKVLDYLDDVVWRAAAAEVLRRLTVPLQEHRARWQRLVDSTDPGARAIGAAFLARLGLVERDGGALLRLVRHEDPTVREFAVGELHAAARANVDVSAAVPALGVALSDPQGGVVYHALRALLAASSQGITLDGAVADLARHLRRARYSLDGWCSVLGPLERAQVERESPAIDAVTALLHHHLACGDAEAIEALLSRDDLEESTLLAAQETLAALSEIKLREG